MFFRRDKLPCFNEFCIRELKTYSSIDVNFTQIFKPFELVLKASQEKKISLTPELKNRISTLLQRAEDERVITN